MDLVHFLGAGYFLLWSGIVVQVVRVRRGLRHARWWLDKLTVEAAAALADGSSLAPLRAHVDQALIEIVTARSMFSDVNERSSSLAERELRIIGAVAALECNEPRAATRLLEDAGAHERHAVAAARFALWRGESPGYLPSVTEPPWELLVRDANAQVDLMRGERVVETMLLPGTAARVRARAGDEDGACALLASLDEQRRDAFLRALPDDPATRVWHRRIEGPYR